MKEIKLLLAVFIFCLGLKQIAIAQGETEQIIISGKVVSSDNNQPLPDANIIIKGSKKGIVTKADGTFTLKIGKDKNFDISHSGYEKQTVVATKTDNLLITLKVVPTTIEEVVVIGYGTRKKSQLTGAVSKLNTDEYMGETPVSRADDVLKGRLAGVNVTTTDAQAGAAPTIQIRGATSISAGTNPLIVIDGYPVTTDLASLNMNDVESIEVLKDAASAAIYGSRGGNGVIIITTKQGRAGTGRITLNVNTGFKNAYRKLKFPNLKEWKQYVSQDNNGVIPAQITQAEVFDANTDAQAVIFKQVRFTNFHLSASGGKADLKYYLSASGLFDEGVMIGNDHKQFGLRAGFNAKVTPKVTIDFGFNPTYTEVHNVPVTVQEALRSLPAWTPVYHTDTTSKYTGMPVGSYVHQRDFSASNLNYNGVPISQGTSNNPLTQLQGTNDKTSTLRGISNMSVKVEISKYLSFKSTGGLSYIETTRDFFQKSWAQAEVAIDGETYARSTTKAILSKTRVFDLSNENIVTYNRIFKKHDLNVIAGFSNQYTNTTVLSGQAGNFATDYNSALSAGVTQNLSSNNEEHAYISYLTRVNYAYNNKYLLSVSYRYDGDSRFPASSRYLSFPAASIGWKISSEKFYPQNKIISDLKIRTSYGATGNNNIGNYRYVANVSPTYTILGNEASPSYQLTSFGNTNLTWERTYSNNVGLDIGVINGKIRVTAEYYKTITDKLLLNLPIVASTGFTTTTINQGKVSNEGLELEISAPILTKGEFSWNVTGNFYTNKNKLLDFGGITQQISDGDPKRDNYFLSKVGQPLVQFYGYKADSIVRIHGTPNFPTNYWPIGVKSLHVFVKDVDGNGRINDSDRVVLGTPYPKYNWGFTSNFHYKSFDISFTLHGSQGAKVFNIDPYYFETQYGTTGSIAYKNPDLYSAAQQAFVKPKTVTDFLVQDASFIALRSINIGYITPNSVIKRLKINRLRFYASASNLWYHFSNSYTSYNPEANNGFPNDALRKGYQRGAVPIARTITFGVNVDF